MNVLYFDCFNGASGDMILGAMLDLGLPLSELQRALGSLAIADYELDADKVLRAGVSATKFRLTERGGAHAAAHARHDHAHEHHHETHGREHNDHRHDHAHDRTSGGHTHAGHTHPHRSLPEIHRLIDGSGLGPPGKDRAKALFSRLAEAEAAIHQMPVDRVHLHEVGALDSIIDIVGAVFALDWIKADRIVVSPLNVGGGMVKSAHGVFPVPAPATLRFTRRDRVRSS
jgi:pyridinium-3,5-bisthiocarboxylic acid mononucleotide nickel chelatase